MGVVAFNGARIKPLRAGVADLVGRMGVPKLLLTKGWVGGLGGVGGSDPRAIDEVGGITTAAFEATLRPLDSNETDRAGVIS
jgi:hypothetical protein